MIGNYWKYLCLTAGIWLAAGQGVAQDNIPSNYDPAQLPAAAAGETRRVERFLRQPDGSLLAELRLSLRRPDGSYVWRNELYQARFRDRRLLDWQGWTNPQPDFWSGVLAADEILQVPAGVTVSYRMPDGQTVTEPVTAVLLPQRSDRQLPVKRTVDGWTACGDAGPAGAIEPAAWQETIAAFRRLPPEAEADWLKRDLLNENMSFRWKQDLLRLTQIGVFRHSLPPEARQFWYERFLAADDTVVRRLILTQLSDANCLPGDPLWTAALQQPELAAAAGEALVAHDPLSFRALMRQWAQNDQLWRHALRQSDKMKNDEMYVERMLRRCDDASAAEFRWFIPLLCQPSKTGTKNARIEALLNNEISPGRVPDCRLLLEELLKARNSRYLADLKTFVRINRQNPTAMQYELYPAALIDLCMLGDRDGIAEALQYLEMTPVLSEYLFNRFRTVYPAARDEQQLKELLRKTLRRLATPAAGPPQ